MNTTLKLTGYTLLNLRFASLCIPFALVTYVMGSPAVMVWVAFGMLILAVGGEVFTSFVQALATRDAETDAAEILRAMFTDAEEFANGRQEDATEGDAEGPGEAGATSGA